MKTGNIYYGDCLELMEEWKKPENWTGPQTDLIYMDPPFNSDEVYNKPHKKDEDTGSAQDIVFTDIWEWDEAAIERTQKMIGAVGHPASKLMESLSILIPESKMLSYISYMAERFGGVKRLSQIHRQYLPALRSLCELLPSPADGRYLRPRKLPQRNYMETAR